MPRFLNRPPRFPKNKPQPSLLASKHDSSSSTTSTTSSGLSRSDKSIIGLSSMLPSPVTSVHTTRSSASSTQVLYDASMSNAAFDGVGRVQNTDWGHFVDFFDPEDAR